MFAHIYSRDRDSPVGHYNLGEYLADLEEAGACMETLEEAIVEWRKERGTGPYIPGFGPWPWIPDLFLPPEPKGLDLSIEARTNAYSSFPDGFTL